MKEIVKSGAEDLMSLPGGGVVIVAMLLSLGAYFLFHAIIEPRLARKKEDENANKSMKELNERLTAIEKSLTQLIMPDNKEHGVSDRLNKIELAIHEFRNFIQMESLKAEGVAKEVMELKAEYREQSKEITKLQTELRLLKQSLDSRKV